TTTMLLEALLSRRFGISGFLGTVAYRTGRRQVAAPRTTPEAPEIQELLAEMVEEGVPAAAVEVSSHALAPEPVAGVRRDVPVFEILTGARVLFSGERGVYPRAKRRFWGRRKATAAGVVTPDAAGGGRRAGEIAPRVVPFPAAARPEADVRARNVRCD